MGQTDLKPTAQGQVESSINDTINFIMAKVAAGEIDAATATELIAAARKDYESNVPVTTSAQQAVQLQQTANPYQADPQTAYAVPEMEPEQTPIDYGQFATSTNYPHTYDVEDSSDVDMDALSGIASDVFDKQPRKKLSRKERKARAKEMKKLQKESNAKLKANAKSNKSIQKQLKDRDKELSKKNEFARYRRKTAKDVTSFIGYNRMYEDGICEVEEGMFSSCICFEDTSYHSVREDAQKAVFTSICRLYDQFGADTLVQFNIINTPLLKEQIGHRKFFNPSSQLNVNAANDAAVFNEILNEKMRQGVSNIRRKMYITFSVSAPTVDDAVPKLARIENQISQILTSIGSKSHVLDGAERLALLNSQLNPLKPFNFDYRRDISARMVQTTKDCIAPMTLDFKPEGLADCFKTGDMWGQVLVIKKLGSELTDQALSDITELPIPLNVTWFAQPMDKAAAVAFTRQRLAWIDKEIIEEQRSAVQKGYDFSILPQELKYSKEETEDVIDNLQNKNQRLYVFTGLFYTYAPTKKQLDNQVLSIISAARQNSIEVSTYEYRQRQGFNSILPLGHNHCEISRMSTTAEVSILMPFATMELDDKGGNYYGQNKHSSNLIFCNRKLLASPMGFVCGKTGSGKGMAVKTEMTGTILSNPTDEIYIIDRAGEYTGISSRYGGVTYNFAVDSDTYLNPFDTVSVESLSPDAQLAFKIDAMLAQAGASAAEAGRDLGEEDQSIITRCVQEAFFDARQRGEQPPLLEDFYNKLLEQPEPEAKTIALRYERFVTGAQSFFNHQSNVDFKSRIVDFNLKDLPDSMLVFGLINVCEAVRNRMYFNAKRGVRTWLYVEEMQSLFGNSNTGHRYQPLSMAAERLGYNWTSAPHDSLSDTLACLAAQKCVDDHNWCVENLELTEDAIMHAKPIENGSEGLPKDCWDLNPGGRPFAVTEPILHRLQSSAKLCARAGTTTQFTRMTVNQWFDKAERSQRSPLGRSVDIGRAASALNSQHEHAEVPQDLTK